MNKPILVFIQGGGDGAYEADKQLSLYLKEALQEAYTVHHPRIPHEHDPEYGNYKPVIEDALNKTDTSIALVGHSVGSCFLLKYLSEEKITTNLAGVFLIATPYWGGEGWQYEGFRLKDDFAATLPANTPLFFYHGTNDEVVPYEHLRLYQQQLPQAVFRTITGQGHQLNNNLPEVVRDIRSLQA